jgi:hypothetical protein
LAKDLENLSSGKSLHLSADKNLHFAMQNQLFYRSNSLQKKICICAKRKWAILTSMESLADFTSKA